MPKLTFRFQGTDAVHDVDDGMSVMEVAAQLGVRQILAVCGGEMACSTCHVYVVDGPVDALPAVSSDEADALEFGASPRLENSRLSCQLPMSSATDGLVVELPERQE